jgi:hypothetical protein
VRWKTRRSRPWADDRTVIVNRFLEGDAEFKLFDNLDFQPRTGTCV